MGTLPPIVLVHVLWITAASWVGWTERFREAGHEVHAVPWPELDRPVAVLTPQTPVDLDDPAEARACALRYLRPVHVGS